MIRPGEYAMKRFGISSHGCVLLLLLFLPRFLPAQTKPHPAEIRLDDGSVVRMSLGIDAIPITTKYGNLLVPISDIRKIEFGRHIPPATREAIDAAVKRLGSASHKERLTAGDTLFAAGHFAAPTLRSLSRSPGDAETKTRAASILAKIIESVQAELLELPANDTIHTTEMPIAGRIDLAAFKASSPHLGEVELQVAGIRSIRMSGNGRVDLVVEASKAWKDTGILVERGRRLLVTADGSVDLWPQTPGQYLATPKGYNVAGEGGAWMAGALIGRISENGKEFLLGERFDGTADVSGRLEVRIVPSPWRTDSTGSYRVKIVEGR